jgi:hypothetical protein
VTKDEDEMQAAVEQAQFIDVKDPTYWAYYFIHALFAAGITRGYGDGRYRPGEPALRSQIAAFIIRAKYGNTFSYAMIPYFSDVPDSFWAFDYIQKMFDEGVTTGYPDGTYRPTENVTRAQMAAFIARARFGEGFAYSSASHFIDVPNTHWAFKYIQKIGEEGITTGYPDGTYRPSQNLNRAQMAAFIARAFLGIP